MPSTKSGEVIQTAIRLTDEDHSSQAIANHLNCSVSLVNAFRSGQRIPSSEQAKKLAKYLFPRSAGHQRSLVRQLDEARDPQKTTLMRELDENNRILKIASTSQSALGRTSGFIDQFVARFFRLAGLPFKFIPRDEVVDLKEQLVQEEVDIGVGIFATLDRSLMIKFFATPIRVGLNAVVLEETLTRTGIEVETLRQVLAPKDLDLTATPDSRVTPIVVKSDVGGHYASKTLGFTEANLEFAECHRYSAYAQKLVDEEDHARKEGLTKTPVALVDDITALYVLRSLDKQHKGARMVFPFSNERSARDEKKWMPEYLVSLSVKRTNVELADYLRDALRLFLRTEIQMISSFYSKICLEFEMLAMETCIANRSWTRGPTELVDSLEDENRERAHAWVEYTFGITSGQLRFHQDFDLPWKPIMETGKEMYAKERAEMLRQIQSRP